MRQSCGRARLIIQPIFSVGYEAFMKKLALAVAMATFSLAGAASAADMPVKAPVMKAPITVSNDWTGFYVGGNIG